MPVSNLEVLSGPAITEKPVVVELGTEEPDSSDLELIELIEEYEVELTSTSLGRTSLANEVVEQPKTNGRQNQKTRTKPVNTQLQRPHFDKDIRPKDREDVDLVKLYLNDIGKYPLITKDDEVRLDKLIIAGLSAKQELETIRDLSPAQKRALRKQVAIGEDARLTFTKANLRLVVSVAKKYQASGLPLMDLIQEGNIGMMHAVNKFDWRKGFKFSTYATWWIRQAITRGIANTGRTIRLPVHAGDTLARIEKARNRLASNLGRTATLAELSVEVDLPPDKVLEAISYGLEPLSLNEKARDDGDGEYGDFIEDKSVFSPLEAALESVLPKEIEKILSILSGRDQQIIRLRFGLDGGEPWTLDQIGEFYNLTREGIRQIEHKSLAILRLPESINKVESLLHD